jgi:hypothetical protein
VRSRVDLAALLLAASLLAAPALVAAAPGDAPTQAEIDAAFAKVKADPNLAEERTVRTLDFKNRKTRKEKKDDDEWNWSFDWLRAAFGWLAGTSRVLVWVVIAALLGFFVLFVVRIFFTNRGGPSKARFLAPTHVQDLDIRPESLPPDIGAAARALWDSGEHRAALALLYRGTVSRLAHAFEVPIRASSTEGDCLALAARTLDATRLDYVTQLVRTWQRAIYGGITVDAAEVHSLCAGFSTHLDPPPEPSATGGLAGATT